MNRAFVLLLGLLATGCLAEDPASFRTVDELLLGRWTFPNPDGGNPTIDLTLDGEFAASNGVPGATVLSYSGRFWQGDGVLAFRGFGANRGGGVTVTFVTYRVEESSGLNLRLIEIDDAFVRGLAGVEDLNALSNGDVENVLRRFDGLDIPDSALGFLEVYVRLVPGGSV